MESWASCRMWKSAQQITNVTQIAIAVRVCLLVQALVHLWLISASEDLAILSNILL